jgi:hypothetical protein
METEITKKLRLKASQEGWRLWRNNVGATYTQKGDFIRYGLANDSTAVNCIIKSSDLIGIKPILITPDMVGKIIGRFVSWEVKNNNWTYKGTEREQAQLNWINLINTLGGEAKFITECY